MADEISNCSTHPGRFIRESVLPRGLSVKDAAKLLGIGRPALSNLLNGNSALSSDMAARIARAFSIPAQKLIDLQAAYDAVQAKAKGAPANTKAYVPQFLGIRANEIESWGSSSITARTRFAVFLRILVNSTGIGLSKVDFPGNDDAERPGWDGYVIASEGTPWVPEGQSGWEFGTNNDPKSKADSDYAKRTKATDKATREDTTLIFITPQRWPNKEKWVKTRQADGKWKDVRAYDASDLEQWLEQSVAGQTWFADENNRPFNAAHSLDKCWGDWANVASPSLVGALFNTSVAAARGKVKSKLTKPAEEPLVVAADSIEEALAFLSQLFSGDAEELVGVRDRVVVFHQTGILPKLAAGSSNFIAVVTNRDVEHELAPYLRTVHSIVVCPRNATNASPDIVLEPLSFEPFESALKAMGLERDSIERLGHESGRSLTVLRRRLAKVDAVRTPEWAADADKAALLVPFLFAGAWSSANTGDNAILELLSGKDHDVLEKDVQTLTRLNDAPVWSVGTYRGVISKIDLLFAISGFITEPDLKTYFDVGRLVLSETDPSLDLPEKDRWAAGLYGKTREISSALREGITETLVLLAVHGNTLFQARLGVNVEARVSRLISELLNPLTVRLLEEHERDLPMYAEAAPDAFLTILEDDLKTDAPASFGLMRPVDSGVFAKCVRAELLWALENLCWSPATLPRAVRILARLAEIKIDDNWTNKPISSLCSVFRSWMPQTAANLATRLAVINQLAQEFPEIAWRICVKQFGAHHRVGHYSHKPRWRNVAQGFGEPRKDDEALAFELKMIEMALGWKRHTRETIGALVERLQALDDAQQASVWDLVTRWASGGASDNDKAWMREKIRVTFMSRRAARQRDEATESELTTAAKAAYAALEPSDVLNKHEWLFRQQWVEESADELNHEEFDFTKREERITKLRTEALQAILAERGLEGLLAFAEMGKAANHIGLLIPRILPTNRIGEFILSAMPSGSDTSSWSRTNLVFGALRGLEDDVARRAVLDEVRKAVPQDHFVKILQLAPFNEPTWAIVDELEPPSRKIYWADVVPQWERQSDGDLNDAVKRLLEAKRPRAAFACVHFVLEKLAPAILFRLMTEIAVGGDEQSGHYQLDGYNITNAFKLLDKSNEFSVEQMAGLEFPYIEVLSQNVGHRDARGVPNLERYTEDHPELFVQAVAWTYKRNDGGEDPPDLRFDEPEAKKSHAERGYNLLDSLKRLPGRNELSEVEPDRLLAWVSNVRKSCAELGRQAVGDLSLGRLFSHAEVGEDGVWPCEPLRHVLELVQSRDISRGITTGFYNARGAHMRAEGGGQERVLADKYRIWADALNISHPFIASTIHRHMERVYEEEAKQHDAEAGIQRRMR